MEDLHLIEKLQQVREILCSLFRHCIYRSLQHMSFLARQFAHLQRLSPHICSMKHCTCVAYTECVRHPDLPVSAPCIAATVS